MAALTNLSNAAAINAALDQEFIANFQGEYDRLAEILGLFTPEVMKAGQVLEMITADGELNNSANSDSSASSGTAYVEGDEVALSKFTVSKTPIGQIDLEPYRKQTSAKAILKSGYSASVLKTDRKMLSLVKGATIGKFFSFLASGTGAPSADAVIKGIQSSLAYGDVALQDALEDANEGTSDFVHFVSRFDTADYLAAKEVTTQSVFGMTYLEDFLGVRNVFCSSKIPSGTTYVTPVDNIHVFGLDFDSLADAGLAYATQEHGLIGVHHTPAYNRVSAETYVLNGMLLFPENKDFIVKASLTKSLDEMTVDELKAYAAAHDISLTGKTTKAEILAAIKEAI